MKIRTGINNEDRQAVSQGLSHLLADSYTLMLKTQNYHWNVTGPMFNTLHAMFELQYNDLWLAVDAVAERIRALGENAPATYATYARLAQVTEEEDFPQALEMVRRLVEAHETLIRTARGILPTAESASDAVTVDLLTQRLEVHEKTAWMLRSLLEA